MTGKLSRLGFFAVMCVVFAIGCLPQIASADLDTANTLMGIDGLVLRGPGLFRSPDAAALINGNDGFNTFQFGSFAVNNAVTFGKGKYDAFRFQKTDVGDCCISHNARFNSNSPEHRIDSTTTPINESYIVDSITSSFLPIIDRGAGGQLFDPEKYQIEVKFKPLLSAATAANLNTNPFPTNPVYPNISTGPTGLENYAPFFQIALDQQGGYVWDAEVGSYKRADEQIFYDIGSEANPINNWYATAPHDADGYATWTVPVTSPSNIDKGFYFSYGDANFRTGNVLTNGGRVQNEDLTWSNVEVGYGPNFEQFGGGPSDPSSPGSKLDVPNGVPLMALGSPAAQLGLSLEIKSVALTRINPTNLVARLDANSGLTFRLGTGFAYGETQPGISVPGAPPNVTPAATNQISRYDANGMTNLILNMRTPNPDPTPETPDTHRFIIRGAPTPSTFDATDAVVNVRARLTEPLTNAGITQNLTIVAKARKGNDTGPGLGADEWTYVLPLNLFNTSTMTTVSIDMADFILNLNASPLGAAPLGFANAGNGLLTNFALYEFGGLIPVGTGLLRMELEFMEIRTPTLALLGDFNGDHEVDAADFTVWRDHLGKAEGSLLNGNGNGGVIDNTDYALWKQNFGMPNGAGGVAGVAAPEPASCALAAFALLGCGLYRRQRRGQ